MKFLKSYEHLTLCIPGNMVRYLILELWRIVVWNAKFKLQPAPTCACI